MVEKGIKGNLPKINSPDTRKPQNTEGLI